MIVPTWQTKKQAMINDTTRNQRFAIKHLGRAMVEWTNQLKNNESKKLQYTREVRRTRHRQGQSKQTGKEQQRGKTGQIKKSKNLKSILLIPRLDNYDYLKTNDLHWQPLQTTKSSVFLIEERENTRTGEQTFFCASTAAEHLKTRQ